MYGTLSMVILAVIDGSFTCGDNVVHIAIHHVDSCWCLKITNMNKNDQISKCDIVCLYDKYFYVDLRFFT